MPDHTGVLDALNQWVIPFLEHSYAQFGYLGVFFAMTIETVVVPLPSEIVLPFAGWSISRGIVEPLTGVPWTFWGAVLAGVAGTTAGSLFVYAVSRYGGRPFLLRYGRYLSISDGDIALGERWFVRWGAAAVFFARMIPIVRTLISIPAGITRMPLWRFTLFSLLGAVPWVMFLVWAGIQLGDNWEAMKDQLNVLERVVLVALVALVLWFVLRWVRRRRTA